MTQDADDFDAWAQGARPRLLRLARSWVKDRAESEDVVQATLLAVWRPWSQGKVQDLDAYARRSVWLNAARRKARWKDWTPLDEARLAAAAPEALGVEPWELEAALARLPLAQQSALRLRYYGGHSLRDCADALKLSVNTVASQCRYAYAALRRSLDPTEKEDDHARPKEPRRATKRGS